VSWLNRKCPRPYCNGDLSLEFDSSQKPFIHCSLCGRDWDENGRLINNRKPSILRGLKTIEHGILNKKEVLRNGIK